MEKKDIGYLLSIGIICLFCVFQSGRLLIFHSKANMYEYLLSRASGVLPTGLTNPLKKAVKVDSLLVKGPYLLATLSPRDCPVCLEKEIDFLKVLHKEVTALPIIIIVSYYPSKGEIDPWLKEWGVDFPYYFDPENNLERENGLRTSEAWNILVKNGRVITSFLPEDNYFMRRAIFKFLHEYLRKVE